jgi:hypothetical protein
MIKNKQHLTLEGFREIVAIRSSLNKGLSENLKQGFPGIVPIPRPMIQAPEVFNSYWISGFVSGDGCFFVSVFKSPTKLGALRARRALGWAEPRSCKINAYNYSA